MADGQAEAAWEAHYRRIYPANVFTPEYMAGAYRPAFIAGKKAGFLCGWEEATEAMELEGAGADPDVADTAWAIIDHHRHG